MAEVRASAPGKVNLVLYCGAPEGGFHPLVTVFETLSLRETVTVRTSRRRGIRVHTQAFFPDGSVDAATSAAINALDPATNLAVRAAKALQPLAALGPWADDSASLDIVVDKRVPVAGGMAGGSADAAATLVACNELWELGLSPEQLEQIGRTLGADVPACLMGGVCLGTGRGDYMQPLAKRMNSAVVSDAAPNAYSGPPAKRMNSGSSDSQATGDNAGKNVEIPRKSSLSSDSSGPGRRQTSSFLTCPAGSRQPGVVLPIERGEYLGSLAKRMNSGLSDSQATGDNAGKNVEIPRKSSLSSDSSGPGRRQTSSFLTCPAGSRQPGVVLPDVLAISQPHWWVLALAHEGLSTPAVFAQMDRRIKDEHTAEQFTKDEHTAEQFTKDEHTVDQSKYIGDRREHTAEQDAPRWPGLPDPSAVVARLLPAVENGGAQMGAALHNDLEKPALALRPELAETMKAGRQAGALGVVLSGSGPTVAALAANREHAERLAELWRQTSGVKDAVIAYGPTPGAQVEEHL